MKITERNTRPWWQTTEFDYIRIPKELFRNPYYAALPPESQLLYGFLLDRASLSWKSGEKWQTPEGDPFVIFTLSEIQQRLHCAKPKAIKLLNQLEAQHLIQRQRPKKDGPYHIVVKPFRTEATKSHLHRSESLTCTGTESLPAQVRKADLNNTDRNYTQINYTDTIRENWEYEFKKNIDYDILCTELPKDGVDSILEVMVDAAVSTSSLWIAGQKRTTAQIQKRLAEVDCMHIRYIFDHMKRSHGTVQSYRAYYLARLWDTPGMVDAFYEAWVRQDSR